MSTRSRLIVTTAIVAATIAASVRTGDAHKPITSKYTYNDDVFPIVRDKCGRCHVEGGVAPMSLLTYEEAFPWAESIRAELIASHMPPWHALDGFGEFKHATLLTAHELDVLLTWATGGNPRGRLDQTLPKIALHNDWPAGLPDVKLTLPEFTVAADKMEDTHEFSVATGVKEARWIRIADLLPGTPSVVRSAVISLKQADAAVPPALPAAERVLARWLPGQDPEPVDRDGAAFRLPPNAELTVRVHYKKTWQFEGKPLKDASAVGLYFAPDRSTQELLVIPVAAPAGIEPTDQQLSFSRTIDQDVSALAVAADDEAPANITVQAQAVLPGGERMPLIRLLTRTDWARRYWFEKPIALPRGTRIVVTANLADPDLLSAAYGGASAPKPPPDPGGLRLSLNVIPAPPKPSAP